MKINESIDSVMNVLADAIYSLGQRVDNADGTTLNLRLEELNKGLDVIEKAVKIKKLFDENNHNIN